MKFFNFLLAALTIAALFVSCSKENIEVPSLTGENAILKVSFVNKSSNPLMARALDDADEKAVHSATLFVINNDGAIVMSEFVSGEDINNADKEYVVTTVAKKVIAVANIDLSFNPVENPKTLFELKKDLVALEDLYASILAGEGFYASGTDDLIFEENEEGKQFAVAEIKATLLPAKINVTVTNNMKNYSDDKGLMLEDVAILYSAGYSQWVATTENGADFYPAIANANIAAAYFRSGFTGWTTEETDQNTVDDTGLLKTWTAPATPFEETFYVYPTPPSGAAFGKNTILVIRASWTGADGDKEPEARYFPVHFNNVDKQELTSGYQYDVKIILKGDASAGGGSVTDPEFEVVDAYFSVTVEIKAWEDGGDIEKNF